MWLIMEVLLAMSLVSYILSYVIPLYNAQEQIREDKKIESRFENFKQGMEDIFYLIRDESVSQCGGYINACAGTVPFPSMTNDANGELLVIYSIPLTFPTRASLVGKIDSVMRAGGCENINSSPLTYRCSDYRASVSVSVPTLDPFSPPVYNLYIVKQGKSGKILVGKTIDLTSFFNYLVSETKKEHDNIAYTLREYHLRRRIEEANNVCTAGGGLNSSDDIYIPWVMQAYTPNPNALCNTSAPPNCSCANIDWSTVNQITDHINLAPYNTGYPNDAFGFKVCVYALTDSAGNPVTPPNPQPNYTMRPPYKGKVFSTDQANCSSAPSFNLSEVFVYAN